MPQLQVLAQRTLLPVSPSSILRQHPHSLELKLLWVEVLVFEDSYSEAEVILDELQQLDPSNDEIYIQRANIHSKQDDHLGAINFLLEALHMTDDALDIHSLLGMEYLFMDDYEKAKRSFIKCLEYDEQDYSAFREVFIIPFDSGCFQRHIELIVIV